MNMDHRQMLRSVRLRPGMYFGGSTLRYDQLVAFVTGVDMGSQGALLAGFREFLILKYDGGSNLWWSALVMRLRVPDASIPLETEDDQAAVNGLFDLLDEFLAETGSAFGATRIYHEYFLWLQQQSWYKPELERFQSYPAPPVVVLDEAAERLGVDRSAMFDLIAGRKLRPSRIGAELYFFESQLAEVAAQRAADPTVDPGADPHS